MVDVEQMVPTVAGMVLGSADVPRIQGLCWRKD